MSWVHLGPKWESVKSIGEFWESNDQCNLNRFITQPAWSVEDFDRYHQENAVQFLNPLETAYFIVDDSLLEKTGMKIEGVDWFYDHCKKHYAHAHNIVTSLIAQGNRVVPFNFAIYKKKESCKNGEFMTKIDIAREQCDRFMQLGFRSSVFLCDEWYGCAKLLNLISGAGYSYVTQAKGNRLCI